MPGKRVREYAHEWGVDVNQVLDVLKRLGSRARRATSILEEEEAKAVAEELQVGAADRSASIVGTEKIVTDSSGKARKEVRITEKVIVRRAADAQPSAPGADSRKAETPTQSVSPLASPSGVNEQLEPLTPPTAPLALADGDSLAPLAPPDEFAFPLPEQSEPTTSLLEDIPTAEPSSRVTPTEPRETVAPVAPAAATCEEAPPKSLSSRPQAAGTSAAQSKAAGPASAAASTFAVEPGTITASTGSAGAATTSTEPRGVKVIGKVDLARLRKEQDRSSRPAGGYSRDSAGAAPISAVTPSPGPGAAEPGRLRKKGKKQVYEKADFAENLENERKRFRTPKKKKPAPGAEMRKTEITVPRPERRVLRIHGAVTVQDLAKMMSIRVTELVAKLIELGAPAKAPDTIDFDTAAIAASEFGYTIENVSIDVEEELEREAASQPDLPEDLRPRPPVVTVMGHVDHGKTSLLDAIRKTNVTAQEAGGITQHIGAYSVDVHGQKITFLDTPGHEAFTAMRARGAKVTDLVILVVAADDGVMPQTEEAINHARAAGVPIMVAITKIDKPEANVERVKSQLAALGLTPEDWGGETSIVPVSARTGAGISDLLEMILLQAELLELKANPNKSARGTIVEAKLDRGRGPVATVLVKEGTLRVGDAFICGSYAGRVRAMIDDRGNRVKEAGPSTPVEILGLEGVPEAGVSLIVLKDEARARQLAELRREKEREESRAKPVKVTLEDIHRRAMAGEIRELAVVLKADVHGSVEALSEALSRLATPEVGLKILHASVGGITESDVLLASASNAIVIGFNVRPESKAAEAAEREGVEIRLYNVIYDVINDVRDAMEGLLEPEKVEKVLGQAEVREVFRVPSVGTVAGCFVTQGKVLRGAQARLVRDHVVVYTGRVASLRRFKEDVREVASGYECGVGLENFQDIRVGDVIEVFEIQEIASRLGASLPRAASSAERRA